MREVGGGGMNMRELGHENETYTTAAAAAAARATARAAKERNKKRKPEKASCPLKYCDGSAARGGGKNSSDQFSSAHFGRERARERERDKTHLMDLSINFPQ